MHLRAIALSTVIFAGCSRPDRGMGEKPRRLDAGQRAEATVATVTGVECTTDPSFATSWPIPEASAAVEVALTPGVRELAVSPDSGNRGALLLINLENPTPSAARYLTLDLRDRASDDIEGMAWRDRSLYTLTSAGAVRRFVPDGKGGLIRDGAAYPIGPAPWSCPGLSGVNCGKNYEGLCLRSASIPARCAGYAASKQEGALHCVVIRGHTLEIDPLRPPLKLALPAKALSDCAFGTEHGPAANVLAVTTNVYDASKSYVVDEATGGLSKIDVTSHVTNEAIAIDREGALYQFMDDNRAPSSGSKARCRGF